MNATTNNTTDLVTQDKQPPAKAQTPQAQIRDLLLRQRDQIALALPKHITADRLMRVALTTINKTPKLLDCTRESLLACIMDCAQLGLEPDNVMGRAYLIPYGNKCTLQIGYKGLVDLAYRSGMIDSIDAFAVHKNDQFKLALGLSPRIDHVPAMTDPGEMTGVYAVAYIKGCERPKFAYMTKVEVDAIRNRSQAGRSGPWVTDYEEMAKKTVIKRMSKLLPMSAEFTEAVAKDNEYEAIKDIQVSAPAINAPTSFLPPPHADSSKAEQGDLKEDATWGEEEKGAK